MLLHLYWTGLPPVRPSVWAALNHDGWANSPPLIRLPPDRGGMDESTTCIGATIVQHLLEGHQLMRRSNPRIVEDGAQSDIPAAVEDGSARRSLLDDQWIRWEVSIPWIRWEVSAPSLLLGNGQVAPHERCRAQRGRSEALAKRVFTILNWGVMISRHLVIAHLVTSIALPLGISNNAVGEGK